MNIELKPIAESKVRQLGGDVCGVLVRKDGKLVAVDEHGRVQWLQSGQGAEPIEIRLGLGDKLVADIYAEDGSWHGVGFFQPEGGETRGIGVSDGVIDGSPISESRPLALIKSDKPESLLVVIEELQQALKRMGYTQPQPAQEGSVSSRDDLIQCLLATRGQSEGVAADAILWLFSATTPQPEGDGWVKCSERLPTEADGDWDGQVIVLDDHGEMACTNWSVATRKIITHWKPTGLKRPQPPQEGEGDE